MSYSHAIRITLPFVDCSGTIFKWADRSQACVVYQHDADEEVSKTHVHLVLDGCEVKAEQLKRMWKEAPGKGNEFWSWKDWDGDDKFLTYMSKGILRPIFVKNFSQDKLETLRHKWVDPVKDARPEKTPAGYYIDLVTSKYDRLETFKDFTTMIAEDKGSCMWDTKVLLDHIRSTTMKVFYAETRMTPPATLYKTVAGTVFLRLCEKFNYFDSGVNELKNLWY